MRGELQRRFSVRRLGVFGSCVRGQACPSSDVDVLVELEQPTFDHYMELKFRLEEVLGRDVDLVLADTLKPRIRPGVEREVQYV
jgi:predicted nucleotidyltransferase